MLILCRKDVSYCWAKTDSLFASCFHLLLTDWQKICGKNEKILCDFPFSVYPIDTGTHLDFNLVNAEQRENLTMLSTW